MLGTFILAFGWFGFNPGSSLAGTDLRIAVVAVNTMLASATGALGATLWMWWVRTKKPDPSMMCNGMLAGLVAITCPCAFVSAGGAFWLPIDGGDTALMILSGMVSILFGIVIFSRPGAGALVTLALIAAFALVTGITEVVVAIGGERLVDEQLERVFAPSRPKAHPST